MFLLVDLCVFFVLSGYYSPDKTRHFCRSVFFKNKYWLPEKWHIQLWIIFRSLTYSRIIFFSPLFSQKRFIVFLRRYNSCKISLNTWLNAAFRLFYLCLNFLWFQKKNQAIDFWIFSRCFWELSLNQPITNNRFEHWTLNMEVWRKK